MTKRTKRALVSSALALLLCFTMLLGTTYAWFTDSVTTVNNKIVAGNLDIELYSAKQPATGTVLDWTMVDANTNIFEEGTLWEPGHVEVAYLWAKNVGTLALEWDLAINIVNEITSTSVLGNALKLSDYLKADLVALDATAPVAYANRTAAKAAVTAGYGLTSYTGNGVLKAGEMKAYALIVYMPEEVGNEANYAKGAAVPTIDMGITLLATQTPFEKDSFGTDYDDNATYPTPVGTADELAAAIANGGDIILTDDVTIAEDTTINVTADTTLDLNDNTLTVSQTPKDAGVALNVFKVDNGVTLTIDGGEFEINFDQNGLNYATGNVVGTIFNVAAGGTLIINGGTFTATHVDNAYNTIPTIIDNNGTVVINGGTFTTETVNMFRNYRGTMTINAGTFTGATTAKLDTITNNYDYSVIWNQTATAQLTVNGGTFLNGMQVECSDGALIDIVPGTYN